MGLRRPGTRLPLHFGRARLRQKGTARAFRCRIRTPATPRPAAAPRKRGERMRFFKSAAAALADFMTTDGLWNLKFELLDKRPISIDGKTLPHSFHYVVDIGRPETAEPAR